MNITLRLRLLLFLRISQVLLQLPLMFFPVFLLGSNTCQPFCDGLFSFFTWILPVEVLDHILFILACLFSFVTFWLFNFAAARLFPGSDSKDLVVKSLRWLTTILNRITYAILIWFYTFMIFAGIIESLGYFDLRYLIITCLLAGIPAVYTWYLLRPKVKDIPPVLDHLT